MGIGEQSPLPGQAVKPIDQGRPTTRGKDTGPTACPTLDKMLEAEIDMFSVVLIGNSSTAVDDQGRMVTPRGYAKKREALGVRCEV